MDKDINQFIYTKVAAEQSPRKLVDFHTVFYPVDLLGPNDVRRIEQKIHVPDLTMVQSKNSVFFHQLNGQHYLVLLCFHNLPDDRDGFGRGGLFLVHGFLFPEAIWRQGVTPNDLLVMVEKYIFTSREAVLASPLVNNDTGDIAPLEEDIALPSPLTTFTLTPRQKKIVQMLINMARGDETSLCLHGGADEVFSCMSDLFRSIPDNLKSHLGWEPTFDGNNLSFFPLNIAGYRHARPMAREMVVIDAGSCKVIDQRAEETVFQPKSSFQNWLAACTSDTLSVPTLETIYGLARVIDDGIVFDVRDISPADLNCFIKANHEVIDTVFEEKCNGRVGADIGRITGESLSAEDKLVLLAENLPYPLLVDHVIRGVFAKCYIPSSSCRLPEELIKCGGPIMRLLNKVWQGDRLLAADLTPLPEKQLVSLAGYLLGGPWKKKPWVGSLILEIPGLPDRLREFADLKPIIEHLLVTGIRQGNTKRKTAALLAREAIRQGNIHLLLSGKRLEIIEQGLQEDRFDTTEIQQFADLVRQDGQNAAYPFIRAFFAPAENSDKRVMTDPVLRNRLLAFFISYHGFRDDKLVKFGFTPEEVRRIKKSGSLFAKFTKHLFNR